MTWTLEQAVRAIAEFRRLGHPGYVRLNYATGGVLVSVEVVPSPFKVGNDPNAGEIVDRVLKTR